MRALLFCSALLAAACSVPVAAPPAPLVAFNPDEVKWSEGAGTANIEGQAFLKTRGGDVKYGAGNPVFLMPNSPHSFAWYVALTSGRSENAPKIDPGLAAVTRKTVAGGDGRFKFENVPAGSYLILTIVDWQIAGAFAPSVQGGFVGAPVTAESGKTVSIVVTR